MWDFLLSLRKQPFSFSSWTRHYYVFRHSYMTHRTKVVNHTFRLPKPLVVWTVWCFEKHRIGINISDSNPFSNTWHKEAHACFQYYCKTCLNSTCSLRCWCCSLSELLSSSSSLLWILKFDVWVYMCVCRGSTRIWEALLTPGTHTRPGKLAVDSTCQDIMTDGGD